MGKRFFLRKILPLTRVRKLVICGIFFGGTVACFEAMGVQQNIAQIDAARAEKRLEIKPRKLKKKMPIEVKQPKKKLVKSNKKAVKEIKFKLNGLEIEGAKKYSKKELMSLYKDYLGKKVDLLDLQSIAKKITAKYRCDGYILSQAIIPPQNIEKGTVRIKVIEGFVDEVLIKGKLTGGTKKLLEKYGENIKKEKPLQYKKLWRYAYLSNDLPGVKMKVIFSPSKNKKGASDLTFIANQTRFAAAFDYNNYGSRYLGQNQAETTAQGYSLFGTADQLTLRGVKTPLRDGLETMQIYYKRPLTQDGLELTSMVASTKTYPRGGLELFDTQGKSDLWNFGLSYPLVRSRLKNVFIDFSFNWMDSKTENKKVSNVVFDDRIRTLQAGVSYDFADSFRGANSVRGELTKGLPILNASEQKDKYPESNNDGKSDFIKFNFELSRIQWITSRISGLLAIQGQYSNDPLLSSEEIGFGGKSWGRGFSPSEMTGDSGLAGKLELRANFFPEKLMLKFIQHYVFYDAGIIWNIDTGDGWVGNKHFQQQVRKTATSAGIGLRVMFSRYLSGSFELAVPLTNKVASQEAAGHNGNGIRSFFAISAHV